MLVDAENAESRSQELYGLLNVRCVERDDSLNAIELLRELARDDCLRSGELILDILDWLDLDDPDAPPRWDGEPLDREDEMRWRHASEVRMPGLPPLGISTRRRARPPVALASSDPELAPQNSTALCSSRVIHVPYAGTSRTWRGLSPRVTQNVRPISSVPYRMSPKQPGSADTG